MAASDHLSGPEFDYPAGMITTHYPPGSGKYPDDHEFYNHVPHGDNNLPDTMNPIVRGGEVVPRHGGEGGYAAGRREVVAMMQVHGKTGEVLKVGTEPGWQRRGLASHLVRTAVSMGIRPRYSNTITDDGKALAAAHGMTPKKPLAGKPKKKTKAPEQPPLF